MPIDPQLNIELKRLLAANQHEQAATLCREGLTSNADSPELLTALALSELSLGQSDAALANLQKAVAVHYFDNERPIPRRLHQHGEHHAPWRTVATWYLWRSLDPTVVQY